VTMTDTESGVKKEFVDEENKELAVKLINFLKFLSLILLHSFLYVQNLHLNSLGSELNRREQELLREYDKLAAGDFTVELEGGQWSYSRLEREPDL
ncbi:hypothetical protein NE476_31585, partial [Enterocloster bolteae]|nr:hypothetical protein [Enterocloster bolteae]